jgi:hypothetical protein
MYLIGESGAYNFFYIRKYCGFEAARSFSHKIGYADAGLIDTCAAGLPDHLTLSKTLSRDGQTHVFPEMGEQLQPKSAGQRIILRCLA